MQIVISTSSFAQFDDTYVQLLKTKGYEVILNPYGRNLKPEESIDLCQNAIGLIAGTESLNRDVLTKLPNLRVISRCGVGLNNVDQDAAKELGIRIFNTPDAPTQAVVELTIALILNLLRKVSEMDRNLRNNLWKKKMGNLLFGKTVGIIGYGRIGKKLASQLQFMGCSTQFYDPFVSGSASLETVLKTSDIISLHVSVSDTVIGDTELSMMKPDSFLINISRGGVVDEKALSKHLIEGHLAGAALDVFHQEPYDGSLKELENLILTPHVGSYAKESRIEMERESVENLLKGLE